MFKLKLVTALCLFSFFLCNAQELTVGVKGGINFSSIGDLNSAGNSLPGFPPDELFSPNKEIGTTFGGYVMINFGKFLIRPEINFAQLKNSYALPLRDSQWTMSRVDIPILIGYEIFEPISVYAGPILSSTSKMDLEGIEFPLIVDKRDLSFGVGLLVDFGRFGFDLRYDYDPTAEEEQRVDIVRAAFGTNVAFLKPYNLSILSITAHINLFRTDKDRMGSFFGNLFKGDKCYCPYD